ncbi:adenosylcobinamide-GDP ribazoletransferase [Cohnella massiliensis]|uniref:adenosylcobinamide-GDP ribazoletransferase n=1 Tax=Cohnella massiliensis TaxID=1816691 RepID=UPI0009BAD607|nr:adenosylcobinamide-GDP ribazoletransferase [Cohnella massiliensis]
MAKSRLVSAVEPFVVAMQFLTRVPVPVKAEFTERSCRRSVAFYPAAGLVIGLLLAGAAWGLARILPPLPGAVLLTALWIGLSGALHLDGLMDTADGLLSHRSRERMLEIMKDSRVGAMGVAVGTLSLLLRVSLLSVLLGEGEGASAFALAALALIPVWSRAFMSTAIAGWPYARLPGEGLGGLFRTVRPRHAVYAFAAACAIGAVVLAAAGRWNWREGAVMLAVMAIFTYVPGALLAASASRKLGGLTGDVYGALNECAEIGLLLLAAVFIYNG